MERQYFRSSPTQRDAGQSPQEEKDLIHDIS